MKWEEGMATLHEGFGLAWRLAGVPSASRRRRGHVALRPRLSPGVPLSRCGTTVGSGTWSVKPIYLQFARYPICAVAYPWPDPTLPCWADGTAPADPRS